MKTAFQQSVLHRELPKDQWLKPEDVSLIQFATPHANPCRGVEMDAQNAAKIGINPPWSV